MALHHLVGRWMCEELAFFSDMETGGAQAFANNVVHYSGEADMSANCNLKYYNLANLIIGDQ